MSQDSNSKGLFGVLPYIAPEVLYTNRNEYTQKSAISIAKNASLIIQTIRPSLNNLNPAIREFHALTKAGIPKNTDKVSYREAQKPKCDTDGTYHDGHYYEYGIDVEKDEAFE
ncbi:hypothetical protein C2G38_2182539 [Gigaspora rosea]|uniref:Uncharacterized protein n=1 Tax=Gigaspora rosea TaxID=44941 RepID=A0A397V9R2_9GLOM|nr:hypothetical protein C2G38_2182539 [Gigaspora rosea]